MKRIKIPVILLFLFLACYLACCMAVKDGYMLPNTTVNGIDISRMDQKKAMEALERAAADCRGGAVRTVTFAGKEYRIDAGDVVKLDYSKVIDAGLKPGQSVFFARGYFWLKSVLAGNHYQADLKVDDQMALEMAIEESGILKAGTTVQTSYRKEEHKLVFTIGKAGEEPDGAALAESLRTSLLQEDDAAICCPVVSGKVEAVDLDSIYRQIHQEPKNATLDPKRNYEVKEAVTGVDFDRQSAGQRLKLAKEGSTVEIELTYTQPQITTEDLKERLFSDKLATYTTQVSGTANRKDNVRLATDKCNGAILLSGDVFSYNKLVGEQTAETGYKLANATMDGELVQAYGGGICQVSSTIFAAALYADLKITERWEHEYVPRYIGAGMDAAVAWDALDFKICNDRDYPVRIDVTYQNGMLTADIWGTKTDDSIVEVETKEVENPDGKHAIQTYRKVYNEDKSQMVLEKVAYSEYLN